MKPAEPKIRVVLFSGGRGSEVLSIELLNHPAVETTLVVNGYDDGKSTGEVRRFLGDCLGPSDYRKNAARVAGRLESCEPALVELLELRLPEGITAAYGENCLRILQRRETPISDEFQRELDSLARTVEPSSVQRFSSKLDAFLREGQQSGRVFDYSDCSVGNIIFAGCFLEAGRDFNAALSDYCDLVHLPPGLLENVTDGQDAYLVAIDDHGALLASEAEIVDAKGNRIEDIYLIDHFVTDQERERLRDAGREAVLDFVQRHAQEVRPNPQVLQKIREADLIVYAPGTQHSSLFPSYLTPGVGGAVASNLRAIKLLITNLEHDADITGASAVSIIDRAVFYLREKGRLTTPRPGLVTHYLINDPARLTTGDSYVPLGSLDRLHDPRVVRIGDYEGGTTGRHDPSKVLLPFIAPLLAEETENRLALLLLEVDELNKISQTLVELVRADVTRLPMSLEVFYNSPDSFDEEFLSALPFKVHNLSGSGTRRAFSDVLRDESFDYVVLFESSGMYKGGDIVSLLEPLRRDRVDAIWGSRRLSINDIHMAYGLLHRNTPIRGAISYLGSHLLSLSFLAAYGRYISDTLSGVKVIRTEYLRENGLDPEERGVNFKLLSVLLRDRAEVFEAPVHYFPISPEKVRRTTLGEGLRALWTFLFYRFKPLRYRSGNRATMRRPLFDSFSVRDVQIYAAPDVENRRE